MAKGILGTRMLSGLDEVGLRESDAPMKRARNAYAPVIGQTQQFSVKHMNYPLADIDLAFQIVAGILANPQLQAHNVQSFLSFAPKASHVQEVVANCRVSKEPNDPRITNYNPIDPKLVINEPKDPRLASRKPKDPRLCINKPINHPSLSVSEPKKFRIISNNLKDPKQYNNQLKADAKLTTVDKNRTRRIVEQNKMFATLDKDRTRRIVEQNKMFSAKKLSLVLDLDHTLLHSVMFDQIDPANEKILRTYEEIDRKNPKRHLFRLANIGAWMKLRPGIWDFLEKASKLFELHINTMGNQAYAAEVVKLLDPTGSLFAGRVTSRRTVLDHDDDHKKIPKTKNLEKVLGLESAALIIDDTAEVWPNNQQNLIRAEMYRYFPCGSTGNIYVVGPSLFEIGHDERPEDGTLSSLLRVIERIHCNFFSSVRLDETDVRSILSDEQRKILDGCRICFSRIFPTEESNPHLHPLWRLAEQFGATCSNQIDEHVTHVVANSFGTEKVNWALAKGRFVVHPSWVEASALLYGRACEQQFALKLS